MTFIITLVCLISTIPAIKSYSQLHWASKLLLPLSNNSQSPKSPWPYIKLNDSKPLLYPIKTYKSQKAKISKIEINNRSMHEIFEILPNWLKYYWLDVFETPSSLFPKIFFKANSKENKLKKNLKSIRYRDLFEFFESYNLNSSELNIGYANAEYQKEQVIEFENNSDEPMFIELFLAPSNFNSNIKRHKNEFNEDDEFENSPKIPDKNNEIEIIKILTQRNPSKLKRTPENISLYGKIMSGLGYGNKDYNEIIVMKEILEKKTVEFPFYLKKRGGVIVLPHSKANIGTVIFQPTQSKKYSASLFIRNGSKIVKEIKISGEGASYKLDFLESDSRKLNFHIKDNEISSNELYYTREYTLFNSGQVLAAIKGIYLNGISCQMHGLQLYPCDKSIKIAPGDSYKIVIFYTPDFHQFSGDYHIEIYTEIEKIEVDINLNFPITNFENSINVVNFTIFTLREIKAFLLFFFSITVGVLLATWQEIRKVNRKNCCEASFVISKSDLNEDFIWIPNTYDPPYFSKYFPKKENIETPESELSNEMPEKIIKPKKTKRKPLKFTSEIFKMPSKSPIKESQIVANNKFLPKKQVKAELRHSIISEANTVASCTSGNMNNSIAENENSPSVTWHTEDDISEIALEDEDYFIDTYRAGNGLFSGPFVQRSYIFENDLQVCLNN